MIEVSPKSDPAMAGCADEIAQAVAPPLAPADQALDLAQLSHMTLGERSLEREVLELFDLQAAILLARMVDEPPRSVAALAHTLCGCARSVGAWKVADAAGELEQLANGPSPVSLTAAMNRLSALVA